MTNMHCFEALDRSLRDDMHRPGEPFSGLVVVFSGDLRQIYQLLLLEVDLL